MRIGTDARPLVWLHGQIKTPPFSPSGRIEAGLLLRRLQLGERISMPHSRPMPSIGPACHELRLRDSDFAWRIVYAINTDSIVILDVFAKKTRATPTDAIERCRKRLVEYRRLVGQERKT